MTGPRNQRSRALWLARQYYFQMLADALDQFVPNPERSSRDNAADSLIYAMRLVGAAIEADEPKEPPDVKANESATGSDGQGVEDTPSPRDLPNGT